ncbi:hypothetical protein BG005_008873 [Podila minutissima]|nr:hypothetical protein BG005_008873 [Podila minutissima]
MSTSESDRDRSRSRSVAGPLIIPTRNIPPRAPQTTAPRKYHGRQSRKPLLDHPVPHHHLQQYQGFVPLHYHHSSSTYQHYPTREPVPPTRRIAHILSEQKRREKINGGFDELKSVIPECAQNTDSKATILRKAVDYILLLEDELRKYTDQYQQENSHDPDNDGDRRTS